MELITLSETVQNKIMDTITEKMEDDFAWMAIVLEKLISEHHLTDIESVLTDVQKPRMRQIEDEIKTLDGELISNEINEINKVILLVLTGEITPALDDMTVVLSFEQRSDFLMPLRRRLELPSACE